AYGSGHRRLGAWTSWVNPGRPVVLRNTRAARINAHFLKHLAYTRAATFAARTRSGPFVQTVSSGRLVRGCSASLASVGQPAPHGVVMANRGFQNIHCEGFCIG